MKKYNYRIALSQRAADKRKPIRYWGKVISRIQFRKELPRLKREFPDFEF